MPFLRIAIWVSAAMSALPLLVVLSSLLHPETAIWQHLAAHVLPRVLLNTVLLCAGVLAGVLLLGVSLAWLVTQYRFPGSRLFDWALMLPLAVPAYVMAFVQVGLLDFTGPLQTLLREWCGQALRLPPVRSVGGAVWVLSLSFYPYVYLLARNAFASQGSRALEVGQSLGLSPLQTLWRVALPLARPWIAAGCLLAIMETLADFGAVYVLGVDTFTTAIYKAWFGLFSLPAATQLASLLIVLAFILIAVEQWQRGARRYTPAGRPAAPRVLSGWQRYAASGFAGITLAAAFVVPLAQLLLWVLQTGVADIDARYISFVWHSLYLASLAALLVVAVALLLAYARHSLPQRSTQLAVNIASVGYAIPGTVLAVGVFIPVAWFDNQVIALLGLQSTAVLKGSVVVLLMALACRFLSVGLSPVMSGFQRITLSQVMAARSLGEKGFGLMRRLYVPLLRGGLTTGVLLVLIDVLKEMPITLMMRPFGWDTLAVRVFEMTSEGEWQRAALPAVMLVLAGLLPVVILVKTGESSAGEYSVGEYSVGEDNARD
jgi:iron(III) transport system permease protein